MSDTTTLHTGIAYEGGRTTCTFAGHADMAVAGMSTIEERPDAWSPPHLLIAAAESCFFLTLLAIAEKMRIGIEGYASTAEGKLTSTDGRHKEVDEILIRPVVRLKDEADRARLPQMFKVAEEHCYVVRSLKSRVRIERP